MTPGRPPNRTSGPSGPADGTTDPPSPPLLPYLGAIWLTLALLHALLQGIAPRGVLGDPLLPAWAKVSLIASEWGLLAAAVAAVAVVFRALSAAGGSSARMGSALAGLRALLAALLLTILAVSWSMFWLSGQFLDGPGLRFAAGNFGSLLAYASHVHPVLVFGMPGFLLLAAAAAATFGRRWVDRLPTRAGWTAIGLLVLSLAVAVAGEIGHRFSSKKVTDPTTGAVYSKNELYRLRRDRNAGPLTHWVTRMLSSGDPLDVDDPNPAVPLIRRPQIPLEQYLASGDRSRLRRWNVIVVLVDSLRVDQLRATGGTREVMPEVEALAREGRVFVDCVTQASHTDYAAPAVFSSHYPLRSRDVYRYPKDPPYPRVMIYDILKALGWRTALYSSQNEDWGQMLNYMQTGGLDVCFHSKSLGVSERSSEERPAFAGTLDDGVTVRESMKWIGERSDVPFFLYLNLQNSHLPYDVPADFPRRFGPAELDFKISIGWYPEEKTAVVKDVYADSLAYVDTQLGRLFRRLKETGQWDRTLVVVTGDHGEAFYEHGSAAHANGVYQEVIRVPLVLRAPGLEPGRDDRPAQLLDVAPGLLHLLGLPPHPGFQGEDPFAPSFRRDRSRFVVSDTPWKTQLGILRSGFKLIRDADTGGSLLYDLAADPGEKTDASALHPDQAQVLKRRLAAWRRAQLEYYENPIRQSREYPPVLSED